MSILLQQKNVGDYSYMSSPNIYYRALLNIPHPTASGWGIFAIYVYEHTTNTYIKIEGIDI